jgi:hypothetical protein
VIDSFTQFTFPKGWKDSSFKSKPGNNPEGMT